MAPGETLAHIYDYRSPLYQKYADLTVAVDRQTLEETVEQVLRALK